MDEDNGVKAPVTRLRRRLSVEQPDDSKSPGPATPTKKRGRLAAKPQLELINEDVNIETKKVTKKAATKDLAEATEEKPLTPARRSTRIKSNTSIVSETAQNYGSPRAKRAARRTSQVGSDNESTSTPVRQTRKTRKDSASSIDKVESTLTSNPNFDSCIITVIVEETDPKPQNQNGSATENEKNEIVLRKSPRLKEKIHDNGKAKKNNDSQEEIPDTSNNTLNETTNKIQKNAVSAEKNTIITEKEPTQLLNTSLKINKEVDDNSKQKLSETNISTTILDDQNSSENKKQKADSQSKINDSLSFDDSKISKQAGNKKDVTINTEEQGQLSDTSLNIIKTSGDKSKHRLSDSHIISMKNQGSSKTKRQKTISLTSTLQSEISDSVCGSDNESTSTPVRQTRKTRRDSASSIDKLESTLASNPNFDSCIITVIVEETDPTPQNQNGSATENEKNEIVLRKSPRLKEKIHDKGKAKKNNDSQEEIADSSNNTLNETTNKIKKNTVSAENNTIITEKEPTQLLNTSLKISKEVDDNSKQKLSETNISTKTLDDQNSSENKKQKADSQSKINDSLSFDDSKISKQAGNKKDVTINTEEHGQLSDTSLNIIKTSGDKSKHRLSDSHIILMKNQGSSKTKRQKTISLTSTSQSEISDSVFFSDNEKSKKRVVKKDVFKDMSSNERVVDNVQIDNNDLCPTKLTDTKTGGLLHQMELNSSANNEIEEISETNATPKSNKSRNKSFKSPSNKLLDIESSLGTAENMKAMSDQDETKSDTTFLEKPSQRIIQSADILEESYVHIKSNVTNKHLDSEDQCVPVVETRESGENSERINSIILNKSNNIMNVSKPDLRNSSILNKSNKQNSMNDSCEPMDIDVTIPNTETSQFNKSSENVKPVTSFYEVNASLINKSNETSKSKSSISAQNLEKSETENKSTLIISQINDVSSSENNVSKSLQLYQEVLSKSTSSDINKEKIMDKKRLSLEQYSTSTPLQQKHTKKLEMQITTYENGSKKTDNSRDSYNKDISIISKSRELNSSSSSESEEKSSKTKSLLEDEADVASDDYESGDSQDEDERQYEAENEVLEKGETLDSEEEFSNDSDYEKDSFVISSNEEDQELLSGSADDLSMSDNELTMSKKSKEKYNMRKIKEQKKASKEMFEARHKLDKSANKSDLKKSLQRSQILESSEDEIEHKKKYKHRRLNSSNEDDLNNSNTNKSLNKRTKKNRLLSESQSECNESTSKEQEITVFNDSAIDDDPLSTKIKQEPKTPLKELNISTVQINDNIEEVEVENNVSFSKTNQTFDPLCSVMVDENSSSLSENPDIVNNYDSILNQLNNECVKSKSLKSHHVSINMDKESKKTKASILDELNVTHTKKSKRNNKSNSVDIIDAPQTIKVAKKAKQNKISNNVDKDSSSDSIDLKLLFSEESTDFDNDKGQTMQTGKRKDSADNFIPLKRTPGKTNIINEQDDEQSSNDEIQFIIDTEGSKQKTDDSWNALLTESAKKKNKKTKLRDISRENLVTHDEGANDEDEDVPLEVPIEISKNEKSRKSINTVDTTEKQKQDIVEHMTRDTSLNELDSAKKKKKKQILEISELPTDVVSNTKKRKRKSSANNDIANDFEKEVEELSVDVQTLNASLSAGRQKKKRKISQHDLSNQSKGKEDTNKAIKTDDINEQGSLEKTIGLEGSQSKKIKKRKREDDVEISKAAKKLKEHPFDKVNVSRLPTSILSQLEDKPKKSVLDTKKSQVISTTPFNVEETKRRKNKPSIFLEESVYLNESHVEKKKKMLLKKPQVLPFVPTAATSEYGFTTQFKINVIPQEVQFVAQNSNVNNYKNDYIYGKKIKRLGTYEMLKKHRTAKISKF